MNELIIENLFLLSLFIIFSHFNSFFWQLALKNNLYLFLMFPGVIVHELFHVLGCFLTGAKIKKLKLFSKKGGYVKHKKAKIPLVGQAIISLAPFIGGVILLKLIFSFFNFQSFSFFNFEEVKNLFIANFKNFNFWLLIYFSISIIINLIPSKKDLKNSFSGVFVIFIFIYLSVYFNLFNNLILAGLEEFKNLILFSLALSLVSLLLAIPISLFSILFSKLLFDN